MKVLVLALLVVAAQATEAVAANPVAAERHWQMAQAYLARGMRQHATDEAEVALRLDPAHAAAATFLGRTPAAPPAAPGAVAVAVVPSATAVAPAAPPSLAAGLLSVSGSARRAYRESRVADARRLAQEAAAAEPGNPDPAAILRALDEETWQPSPLANNEVLHELFESGTRLYRLEAWNDAAGVYQKALAISPSHEQIRSFFNRSRARAEDAQAAAGLARAREAIAAGRPAEAKVALAAVLAARPGLPEALALQESLGAGAQTEERRRQAKESFNKGVEAWEQGRWEDARRSWELVVTLDPADAEAKKLLAKARAKVAAARREARARVPALHESAMKAYQAGKTEDARRVYHEILELDPEDAKAKRSLELIEGRGPS